MKENEIDQNIDLQKERELEKGYMMVKYFSFFF